MAGCGNRGNMGESYISRSEQAPRSGFDPRNESVCSFLGPPSCNKKVYPEKYVSCG